jgi:hypothetical protein
LPVIVEDRRRMQPATERILNRSRPAQMVKRIGLSMQVTVVERRTEASCDAPVLVKVTQLEFGQCH